MSQTPTFRPKLLCVEITKDWPRAIKQVFVLLSSIVFALAWAEFFNVFIRHFMNHLWVKYVFAILITLITFILVLALGKEFSFGEDIA